MGGNRATLITMVGIGLLGAGIGLTSSRPTLAQTQIGGGHPFPRQSELWTVRYDTATFATVQWESGPSLTGYVFVVSPDATGRLPVVTGVHRPTDSTLTLLRQGPTGKYRTLLAISGPSGEREEHHVQVPLPAGSYLIASPPLGPDFNQVVLTGYLARP